MRQLQEGQTLTTEPRQVPMVDLPLGATEDLTLREPLISKRRSVKGARL